MAQEAILGSKKFAALHRAYVRTGTFLYVPKNVEVALPLEAFHWLSGGGSSTFPHTLIIAEAGSKVTLVDYYASDRTDETGFACAVNDLIVGPGAKVTYLCAQNWGEKVVSFQINSTTVERDAAALSLHLNLGASYARLESLSRLVGAGSRSDMLAATVADGTQEFDQRTLQDHLEPHTTSDLLYKNALNDTSKTIFAGLIRVQPEAQHTDAYQKVRNLMLSDDAEADSMPGLEILADEVRCTHGATSGHVAEEEMFYLLSRGIDKRTAQELIVHGFLNEVLERLNDANATPRLGVLLAEKFARMKRRTRDGGLNFFSPGKRRRLKWRRSMQLLRSFFLLGSIAAACALLPCADAQDAAPTPATDANPTAAEAADLFPSGGAPATPAPATGGHGGGHRNGGGGGRGRNNRRHDLLVSQADADPCNCGWRFAGPRRLRWRATRAWPISSTKRRRRTRTRKNAFT